MRSFALVARFICWIYSKHPFLIRNGKLFISVLFVGLGNHETSEDLDAQRKNFENYEF